MASIGQAESYQEELQHLQLAIANSDQLDDFIPEQEVPKYLVFIEDVATCSYSPECQCW